VLRRGYCQDPVDSIAGFSERDSWRLPEEPDCEMALYWRAGRRLSTSADLATSDRRSLRRRPL